MSKIAAVLYFLILSVTAAGLLMVIGYFGYAQLEPIGSSERMVVGGIFIACCALCASMAIYPNWPRECVRHEHNQQFEGGRRTNERRLVAHHPDCSSFQSHRIALGDVEYCSGCIGLMLGSVASIGLMSTYLLLTHDSLRSVSHIFVFIGFCALLATFAVSLMRPKGPVLNTFANAMMVPGLFLLTVGILEMTGSLYAALLVILFSFLWADTRIHVSQWSHQTTCKKCENKCKMY